MVFEDEVHDPGRKTVAFCEGDTIGDVFDNRRGGDFGGDIVVWIDIAADLVLDKETWVF